MSTGYVFTSSIARGDLLTGAIPQLFDHAWVEVPKGRVHDCRLDISEYAAAADDIKVETAKTKLFAAAGGFWREIEGCADVAGLLCNG